MKSGETLVLQAGALRTVLADWASLRWSVSALGALCIWCPASAGTYRSCSRCSFRETQRPAGLNTVGRFPFRRWLEWWRAQPQVQGWTKMGEGRATHEEPNGRPAARKLPRPRALGLSGAPLRPVAVGVGLRRSAPGGGPGTGRALARASACGDGTVSRIRRALRSLLSRPTPTATGLRGERGPPGRLHDQSTATATSTARGKRHDRSDARGGGSALTTGPHRSLEPVACSV